MKITKSVVFSTALLWISAVFLGYFILQGKFFYSFVWGGMAGFAAMDLFNAIRVHGGEYKTHQLQSALSTTMVVVCIVLVQYYYSCENTAIMLYWGLMGIVNVWLIYRQRKTFKLALETNQRLEAWLAEHFPEGQDDEIKLER